MRFEKFWAQVKGTTKKVDGLERQIIDHKQSGRNAIGDAGGGLTEHFRDDRSGKGRETALQRKVRRAAQAMIVKVQQIERQVVGPRSSVSAF